MDERKRGRPTKYHEQMPELLIFAMSEGKSVVRFCADHSITKETFYRWVKDNSDFNDSFELGKILCEGYWEKWLVNNFTTDKDTKVNSALVKLFFANRFGWHDKSEVKQESEVKLKLSDDVKQIQDIRDSYKKEF